MDIKARDQKGHIYDIEVPSTGDKAFVNRSLYYWARLYASQLTEGERYQTLRPTISINLLNFEIFSENPKAHSCFLLHERGDVEITGFAHGQCVFHSSGSEAVKFAVKCVRVVSSRKQLLTLNDSYHGAYETVGICDGRNWFGLD